MLSRVEEGRAQNEYGEDVAEKVTCWCTRLVDVPTHPGRAGSGGVTGRGLLSNAGLVRTQMFEKVFL